MLLPCFYLTKNASSKNIYSQNLSSSFITHIINMATLLKVISSCNSSSVSINNLVLPSYAMPIISLISN